MRNYETQEMPTVKARRFMEDFMNEIGTECEINHVDDNLSYVFCVGMETQKEIDICREIEEKVSK